MRASELREQTMEELHDKEQDLAEKIFALRLQKVTGQLENPARIRSLKRDLARVMTVKAEKSGKSTQGSSENG